MPQGIRTGLLSISVATTESNESYQASTHGLLDDDGHRSAVPGRIPFGPDTRARLGEVRVAPVSAEIIADETTPPVTVVPKSGLIDGKRAEVD